MRRLRVAVDGGQTGIRARLTTVAGRVTGVGTAPGFTYRVQDPVHALAHGVRAAIQDAGWRTGDIAETSVFGLSGLPRGAKADHVAEVTASLLGGGTLFVGGDHITAHAGALGLEPGVVVSVGTGSVAVGLDDDGLRVVDGWGYLVDDAGSGAWIGRAGVRTALRDRDGRLRAPLLASLLEEQIGDLRAFQRRLHESDRPSQDLADLAPAVFDAARAGDPAARGIVEDAAREIAASAHAAAAGASAAELPVVITGGVSRAGEVLFGPLDAALAVVLPAARRCAAVGDSLDGAASIASQGPGRFRAHLSEYRLDHGRVRLTARAAEER